MSRSHAPEQLSCSFCEKPHHQVRGLIEGGCRSRANPSSSCVFICDECIELCAQIMADRVGGAKEARTI
jgi:ATP-dependent Clp protease ATP-binding subunit ClpX